MYISKKKVASKTINVVGLALSNPKNLIIIFVQEVLEGWSVVMENINETCMDLKTRTININALIWTLFPE